MDWVSVFFVLPAGSIDPLRAVPRMNPYEAQARAAACTVFRGEMYTVEPGKIHAPFAPKRCEYGPFRFGEVYG